MVSRRSKSDIILAIKNSADEFYSVPAWNPLRKEIFRERSYRKSAIEEVIERIRISNNPKNAMSLLMMQTNKYYAEKPDVAIIHAILNDAAEFALDIINAMEGEDQ